MVSSNAAIAERFTPRDESGFGAGELAGTEFIFVIGARTDDGAVIPTLFGVEAIESGGFSLVAG
jgi:hypothetical protein